MLEMLKKLESEKEAGQEEEEEEEDENEDGGGGYKSLEDRLAGLDLGTHNHVHTCIRNNTAGLYLCVLSLTLRQRDGCSVAETDPS